MVRALEKESETRRCMGESCTRKNRRKPSRTLLHNFLRNDAHFKVLIQFEQSPPFVSNNAHFPTSTRFSNQHFHLQRTFLR